MSAPEPKLLITSTQRAQNAAFRAACGRASLPAGFRIAKLAGASSGDGSGFGKMIGQITASLLDEQEMLRHGQWRYEALLGKTYQVKTNGDEIDVNTPVCAICFEKPLGDPALPCAHAFGCADCAARMIGEPCPICRVPVTGIGKPANDAPTYIHGVTLLENDKCIVFRAPSAGSKRSAAWKHGLCDNIVLLGTKADLATAFDQVGDFTAKTTLIEYAGMAPSLFWSAALFLRDSPGLIDEAMLALFQEFARNNDIDETQAKKPKIK